jgi:hypothetical protein
VKRITVCAIRTLFVNNLKVVLRRNIKWLGTFRWPRNFGWKENSIKNIIHNFKTINIQLVPREGELVLFDLGDPPGLLRSGRMLWTMTSLSAVNSENSILIIGYCPFMLQFSSSDLCYTQERHHFLVTVVPGTGLELGFDWARILVKAIFARSTYFSTLDAR